MAEVKKLIEGYKEFYSNVFAPNKKNFENIKFSQNPKTLIISCCDSRVDPAILTNAEIGDIFVVRNVANLVPPYQPDWTSCHGTSSAIEYAVKNLKVKHIVVLGHSNCGGIKSLIDNDLDMNENDGFISNWLKIANEIKYQIPNNIDEKYEFAEKACIKLSLKNLLTFPCINEKVQSSKLQTHGWYFSLNTGKLSILNKIKETFEILDTDAVS